MHLKQVGNSKDFVYIDIVLIALFRVIFSYRDQYHM